MLSDILMSEYPQLLSDAAYKLLMRILSASKKTQKVEYPDMISLNKRLHIDSPYSDSPWRELEEQSFIRMQQEDGSLVLKLNWRRVNSDCGREEFGKFKIIVGIKQEPIDQPDDDSVILSEISSVLGLDMGSSLSSTMLESVKKISQYHDSIGKDFNILDIKKMLGRLKMHDHHVIEEACQTYNENVEMHTTKGWGYLVRIAGNIAARPTNRRGSKYRKAMEVKFKERDNPARNDLKAEFALKLASGDVDGNRVYKKMAETQPLRLVELWNQGCRILRDKGEESKIRSDYSWLRST